MRARKKPIEVEATRWIEQGDHPAVSPWGSTLVPGGFECDECPRLLEEHGLVKSLEGTMRVCPGDWVITGVSGEHYAIKPETFERSYDRIEEIEEGEEGAFEPSCTCDHPGDERCPIHWRENMLQDENILMREILGQWFEFIRTVQVVPVQVEQGARWLVSLKDPMRNTLKILDRCQVTLKKCEEMPSGGPNICGCVSCLRWRKKEKQTFIDNMDPSIVPGPSPESGDSNG